MFFLESVAVMLKVDGAFDGILKVNENLYWPSGVFFSHDSTTVDML